MPAALQNLGLIAGFTPGASGWDGDMEANLRRIDALGQIRVVDKDLSAPPGSPATGALYIVGPSPTGAWAGQATRLARWSGSAWEFYVPRSGWYAFVIDEQEFYYYNTSGSWEIYSAYPVDLMAAISGPVPANAVLLARMPFARRVTFPANFSGSVAISEVPPTFDVVFTVYRNDASVGTITFVEATNSATFSSAGGAPVVFNAGDNIRIAGPATADATLANIGLSLSGTK